MRETPKEVASLLRQLADGVEDSESVSIRLGNESVNIPGDAEVKLEYERALGADHLLISVIWRKASASDILIHRHSEEVVDHLGHRYEVLIYGRERSDGNWEAWLEFAPLTPNTKPARTDRETTQPDRGAIEYWATGLEPLYLAGAFERAS